MKYTIRELETCSVIGQEVELTNYQKRNIQISTQFWRKFNSNLKKSYLSQSGNWENVPLWKEEMRNYFISILFQKGMSFQIILSIKKYNITNILL